MENKEDLIQNIGGRIKYVEPNDVLGHVGNKPITPDYTDFCVAFKLSGEIVNRTRFNGYEGENSGGQKFVISWMGSKADNGERNVDFSGGVKFDNSNKSYISTYYTDVNIQDIRKHEVIDGLGVESIDIQFKNYYTPTITIKFVDVRGSSLFGREEAIHKNGEITADNVFGCFFTMPYPKFKLQIKGYYGREVTYQLYCSNFKGNFNSSTGNFEATVTFLGNMYGILSDVPMAYIMIAPYCSYVGSEYWDNHVKNDSSWKLYETGLGFVGEPVKMFKLREDIKSAIRGDREYFVNLLNGLNANEIGAYTELSYAAEDVVREFLLILDGLKTKYGSGVSENGFIVFNEASEKPTSESLNALCSNSIEVYNTIIVKYNKYAGTNYEKFSFNDETFSVTETYSEITRNSKYKLKVKVPMAIVETQQTTTISEKILEKFEKKANRESNQITIKHFIGLYPYIANVIKNSICHFETFMKMLKTCVDEVYSSKESRTFEKLKIQINDTDCKNDDDVKFVPPFPGITVFESVEEASDENVKFETANESMMKNIGWLGDYTSDAPEVKLVNAIFDAMQKKDVDEKKNKKQNEVESDEDTVKRNRDIKVAIYIHLKNIYDRWLINEEFNEYKVGTYFNNFVFIDSFFRNIGYALHVNPENLCKLLEKTSNDDGRFLSFISSLTSKEHCMIFGFPNTFMFEDYSGKDGLMDEGLISAFKPIPYSKMGPIDTSNKIVILYTYKPSEITSEKNGYRGDFFDVYTDGEIAPSNLPIQLKSTGYGYNIPSFGVTFGRQDNAIFKSFNLSMENPVATEQSIKALSTLASKAGASRAKIQYYGQDIYQVYSGYSYFCEFDMMGDVQIMPLMYFQLLNIPMFRGAYMIIDVSHSMKQGDMVTHVKGMRMSRNALPLTKAWFTPELVVQFDEKGVLKNREELISNFVSDESQNAYRINQYIEGMPENLDDMTWREILEKDVGKQIRQIWLMGYDSTNLLSQFPPDSTGHMPDRDYEKEHIGTVDMKDYGWPESKSITLNRRFTDGPNPWLTAFIAALKNRYAQVSEDAFNAHYKKFTFDGYLYRRTKGGPTSGKSLSNHALGSAIDICHKDPENYFQENVKRLFQGINNKQNFGKDEADQMLNFSVTCNLGNMFWASKDPSCEVTRRNWTEINDNYKRIHYQDKESGNWVPFNGKESDPYCIRNAQHPVVLAFEDVGWKWHSNGDTMHFSFCGG